MGQQAAFQFVEKGALIMEFDERAKCHLTEENWEAQERAECDSKFGKDREINKFCHETVERDLERRRSFCRQSESIT
jgi:hypothetical protein